MNDAQTAGQLAFDILHNRLHLPLVKGKANVDNIEEQITIGILSGELKTFVTQDILDLAIETVNDIIMENIND